MLFRTLALSSAALTLVAAFPSVAGDAEFNRRLRAESKVTVLLLGFIAIAAACPIASQAQATATQAQTPTASKAQTPTVSPAQASAASKAQTITAYPQTQVTCLAQCVSLKQQVPQMTQQLKSLISQMQSAKQAYEQCLATGSNSPATSDQTPVAACSPQADLATVNSLTQQVQTLESQLNFLQQVSTYLGC